MAAIPVPSGPLCRSVLWLLSLCPPVTKVVFQLVGLLRAVAAGLNKSLTAPFVFDTTNATVNVTLFDGWGGVTVWAAGSLVITPTTEAVLLQETERMRSTATLNAEEVVTYSEVWCRGAYLDIY